MNRVQSVRGTGWVLVKLTWQSSDGEDRFAGFLLQVRSCSIWATAVEHPLQRKRLISSRSARAAAAAACA